jgi:hypothetical protein
MAQRFLIQRSLAQTTRHQDRRVKCLDFRGLSWVKNLLTDFIDLA